MRLSLYLLLLLLISFSCSVSFAVVVIRKLVDWEGADKMVVEQLEIFGLQVSRSTTRWEAAVDHVPWNERAAVILWRYISQQ
jgi:hypothetical protein